MVQTEKLYTYTRSNSFYSMTARDVYHEVFVQALVADGWTITDDH
jgi:DNA-directed RNA polymerase specialized sigma24 family protein